MDLPIDATLPPIDPSTLEQNPGFSILYKDLCTRKLNADGSSKDVKRMKRQGELHDALIKRKTQRFKHDILLRTLADLPSIAPDLPPELHEVIEVVTAQLSGHVTDPEDRKVLAGDIEVFLHHIEPISKALSHHFATIAKHMTQIVDPLNPSSSPITLPSSAQTLYHLSAQILPAKYASLQTDVANLSHHVLLQHLQLTETTIRILESTMHGSISRSNKAQAEFLGTWARNLNLQMQIHTLTHPPPPAFVTALQNFKNGLRKREMELQDREDLAKQSLALYERAGKKAMLDIAKRAMYLRSEIERAKEDMRRLEEGR